uniref:Alpha 1,4-glycosyltransferase domain-containing protein n=1 Tax=Coccolithus braarudii TaxID=221442 RepID=A0A7S0PUT1_9EUKA
MLRDAQRSCIRKEARSSSVRSSPVLIDVRPKAVRSNPVRRCSGVYKLCVAGATLLLISQFVSFAVFDVGHSSGRSRLMVNPTRVLDAAPLGANTPAFIPMIIHQSWRDGGFPKSLFNWRWQAGLLELNPGWMLMKWTDNSSRELIAANYTWFLAKYDAYASYIQRSDAARYFIVYHYGGVYADLDIECFRPFAPVLAGHRVVFSYKQGTNMSRGLVNAIFASEARHPLWRELFDELSARAAAGATAQTHVEIIRSTGPGLLRAAVERLQDGARLEALGVTLLAARIWHPIMPEQKRGRGDLSEAQRLINASYCYHHFVSSWMQHDRGRHLSTDSTRRSLAANHSWPVVPVGQSFRATNQWRSFYEGNTTHARPGP